MNTTSSNAPRNDTAEKSSLITIISGGQTGVDRGALDAAIEHGIAHGGKCPRGRLAEDGRIPDCYQLEETSSRRYSVRTERNVVESDGTLIMYYGKLSTGTELTRRMAIKNDKPFFLFDFTSPPELFAVVQWLEDVDIHTLNCAGPRESSCPGIGSLARQLCLELFAAAGAKLNSGSC